MDISSIGAGNSLSAGNLLSGQYSNSAYVPLSSGNSLSESGGFAELLKRAQPSKAVNSDSGVPSTPVSKRLPIDKTDKLYEACMELETFLIKNLIKSMRNTVQKSNLIDSGFAGEMYEDMLYDEYAKDYARNANFGFAEMAYRELSGYR